MTITLTDEAPEVSDHPTCFVVNIYHDEQPWMDKGRGEADVPQYRHVFTCHAMDMTNPVKPSLFEADDAILNLAFEAFNIGETGVAADYRARRLRSLSVGDVVEIDGRQYRCASLGWTRVPNEVRANRAARTVIR
jgi:hypothetical protein